MYVFLRSLVHLLIVLLNAENIFRSAELFAHLQGIHL